MTSASPAAQSAPDPLLRLAPELGAEAWRRQLAADARRGLTRSPKSLPPKYFYDDRGSELFETICELPEYYLSRTETAVLADIAAAVVAQVAPTQLVELGSGASRKTRLLLDALVARGPGAWYVPIDVSDGALHASAARLREAYPGLGVHGIVADFEPGPPSLPPAARRLVAYLGSSIGNFVPPTDAHLLRALAARLQVGDALLLGVDLVKREDILLAAYDDAAGVTAEFNRNVLRVINRLLDADFDPAAFDHVVRWDAATASIEMHLRARRAHRVRLAALDLSITFAAGETIHTETSRKFTRASVTALLAASAFRLTRWDEAPGGTFALALATLAAPS